MKSKAKKLMLTFIGWFLIAIGVVFLIIPGPGLLFIIPGLFVLSLEYDWAKPWLRKAMRLMSKCAQWLDSIVTRKKFRA